jgi:hypothetical protein
MGNGYYRGVRETSSQGLLDSLIPITCVSNNLLRNFKHQTTHVSMSVELVAYINTGVSISSDSRGSIGSEEKSKA